MAFPAPVWISNGLILSPGQKAEVYRSSLLLRAGKIQKICPVDDIAPDDAEVIDATEMLIIPGLVNAHVHSHGVLTKWKADPRPLEMWSPYVAAGRAKTREEARLGALLVGIECLQSGVTTILDHALYNSELFDEAAAAYAEIGIRATLAPCVVDVPFGDTIPTASRMAVPPEFQKALSPDVHLKASDLVDFTRKCIEKWNGHKGLLSIMVGPSAPQRCSPELLRGLGRLAKECEVGVHTHFLETKGQALFARQRLGKTMGAYLDDMGLLTERTSLAHGVWIRDEDVRRLADRGTMIIHNPMSNLTLGSGIMPTLGLIEGGVELALGTDGPNTGGHHCIFECMRLATALPRANEKDPTKWFSCDSAFRFATQGGARAVGLTEKIGTIAENKEADLVLLRRGTSAFTPLNDPVRQLVFCERGTSIDTVLVKGQIVVKDGVVRTVNEKKILADVEECVQRRAEQVQHEFNRADKQAPYTRAVYQAICDGFESVLHA